MNNSSRKYKDKKHVKQIEQLIENAVNTELLASERSPKKSRSRQRKSTNRVTMQDVAKYANVSASTVSLYLRDPKGVSEKRAEQIKAAIDKLNYVPNLLAGGLAATHTRVIAVIVPSLMNAFFAQTVSAMQRHLGNKGYQLLVGDSEYDLIKEQELVRTFLAWSPAGLIVTGATHTDACSRLLAQSNSKVIEMWELSGEPTFCQVGFSHFNVGRLAASHLFSLGCKQVAYIGANTHIDKRAQERGEGFAATWQKMTNQTATIIDIDGFAKPATGVTAMKQLIESFPLVDGVFCSNDIIAMGLMAEANKLGIAIPQKLAVISFGDLPFAEVLTPSLTTIRPPSELIAQHAIDQILSNSPSDLKKIALQKNIDDQTVLSPELHSVQNRPNQKPQQIDLAFELVVRGSS